MSEIRRQPIEFASVHDPEKKEQTGKIDLVFAEVERLDPYGAEFFYPSVHDGEDVSIGLSPLTGAEYFIRADFRSFEEQLRSVDPETLNEMFGKVDGLLKEFPDRSEEERRMIHAFWRTARIVKKLLGGIGSRVDRSRSFVDSVVTSQSGSRVGLRNLSETKGKAACAELSILSHHVLRKMGIDSAIVTAAVSEHSDDSINQAHTFIVFQKGEVIFDPTESIADGDGWPPAIYKPEAPLTAKSLQFNEDESGKMFSATDIITGGKRKYGTGIGQ